MKPGSTAIHRQPVGRFQHSVRNFKNIRQWRGLGPLVLFLVLTIPLGLYLVLAVPDMWAADGGAQVARAFQIAEGGIRPYYINHHPGIGYGGTIPLNVNDLKTVELTIIGQDGPAGAERETKLITPQDKVAINQIKSQKISKQRILISYVNTAAYSPVAYAPSVIGLRAGMSLNLTLGHTLLLARLCGLCTFIVFAGYALFTLRKNQLKWIVVTVALLPLVVFQATLITADAFLMSTSLLLSALLLKAFTKGSQLTRVDKILLFACLVMIPLTKSVYFPLMFIVLFLPKRHWSTNKKYWIFSGAALAVSLCLFAAWSLATLDVAASNGLVRGDTLWKYGDAQVQKRYLIGHPQAFIAASIRTLLYQSQFYIDTYFGWLGFTYLPVPGFSLVAGYLALGLSVLLAGKMLFKKYVPAVLAATVALILLIMFVTFYIAYTPPMYPILQGLQGRYFLPVTVLALAALAMYFPKLRIADSGLKSAKIALVCLISFSLVLAVARYGLAITT